MNKSILLVLLVVVLSTAGYSYIMVKNHMGVGIKYYNVNETYCKHMMDNVPAKYYENLRSIKIWDIKKVGRVGQYWWGGYIELFDGCDWDDTLIHELAHHCQAELGDTLYQGLQHIGLFEDCLDEIKSSIGYD